MIHNGIGLLHVSYMHFTHGVVRALNVRMYMPPTPATQSKNTPIMDFIQASSSSQGSIFRINVVQDFCLEPSEAYAALLMDNETI